MKPTNHTLIVIRDYSVVTVVIISLIAGYIFLLNSANARIEAKCAAAGGQVLTQPGEASRCLRPAH